MTDTTNKPKPILFSGPMVRAILEGCKTQTRRVVKPQRHPYGNLLTTDEVVREVLGETRAIRCPYGQPGDRLWVRETFALECQEDGNEPPHNDGRPVKMSADGERWTQPHYRATDKPPQLVCYEDRCRACNTDFGDGDGGPHWRPSIHMPRWASRITLEIVSVRVERLHQMPIEDVKAEGVEGLLAPGSPYKVGPFQDFEELWESINGPGSWAANPWVWVVEFKRIEQGESK